MAGKRAWYAVAAYDDRTLGGGVNDAVWVETRSYAKRNSDTSPYLIPNEWIAGRLAQFLCLDVPPFALVRQRGRAGLFASLKFTSGSAPPHDVDPAACIRELPSISTGVILFDVLIANCDRHEKNLAVDDPVNPRRIVIIDHDRALLGYTANGGVERLQEMRERFGISAGSVSGGNRHVLLGAVKNTDHFSEWIARISAIPDWYIIDTCEYVQGVGLRAKECREVIAFLKFRRDNLTKLLDAGRDEFRGVQQKWLFIE